MTPVWLSWPSFQELAPADTYDILAFTEYATETLRLRGYEPTWSHDPAEPPPIGLEPILRQLRADPLWRELGALYREEAAYKESPPLVVFA